MSTKKLRDDLDSLTEFLSDLNNYKVTSDFLSISDRVSPNFIAAVIDRLPLRLRDLFLDQLARRKLLNCKECWVNELINFIENRIGILDSDLVRNRTRNFERLDKPSQPQSKVCFVSSRSKNVNVISSDCDSKVSTDRNELKNVSKNAKRNLSECFYCSKLGHQIYSCYSFISESLNKRLNFVSDKGLCFSCLRLSHGNSKCPIRAAPRLPYCKKGHHALLCSFSEDAKSSSLKPPDDKREEQPSKKVSIGVNQVSGKGVRLHVLPVVVSNECGDEKEVYAMFGNGSEESLISKDLVDFLGLKGDPINVKMLTADGRSSNICTAQVDFKIGTLSRNATYDISGALTMETLPSIDSNFPCISNLSCHEHLKDLTSNFPLLSDQKLHVLIGTKECFISQQTRVRQAPPGKPWAAKTKLGWVVYGEDNLLHSNDITRCNFVRTSNEELDRKLDFWLEANFEESRHDETLALSQNDKKVLSIYEKSLSRVGKHNSVPLPFKREPVFMPNNFELAKKRILSLSRTLTKSPNLLVSYVEFMKQLFKDGHAVILDNDTVRGEYGRVWYLNHHMVHSGGKDRVVFNCSGEFEKFSLNKMLLKGPTLANSLIGVFLRFRIYQYALVGDIRKMYYQCFVNEPFQDFMRFLWFRNDSPTSEIIHCRMTRLAYGLICAQSGAQFCLQQAISRNEVGVSAFTVDLASSSFYVDDFLTSASSQSKLLILHSEIFELLQSGGFFLTKFHTNCHELRNKISPGDCSQSSVLINLEGDGEVSHKALGMHWNAYSDCIYFSIKLEVGSTTRRGILSTFSQIFDPFGIIQPLLIVPKLLIRTLCKLKLDWDVEIPSEQANIWFKWLENIDNINSLSLDRCLVPSADFRHIEVHAFSDASSEAYASIVFLRVVYHDCVKVNFLIGKCKIAPMRQTLTVPKLELIAACLSVRLVKKVIDELTLKVDKVCYWVDAVSVLHMINNMDKRFKVFVANHLALIHDYSKINEWRYCPSSLNVADVGSRPLLPSNIERLKQWIGGPEFLCDFENNWPIFCSPASNSDIVLSSFVKAEEKNVLNMQTLDNLIVRHSKWNALLRAIAIFVRFKQYLKGERQFTNFEISSAELDVARNDLCRYVQAAAFSFLLQHLNGKHVSREHKNELNSLKKLTPFVDNNGVTRVGGRIQKSAFDFDVKHPILLPKRHHLVKLIVVHYHEISRHSGYNYVLAQIRQLYWIVNGQSTVRHYLRDCFYCSLRRAKAGQQIMSPLPFERTSIGDRAYTVVGVDFFGPEFFVCSFRSVLWKKES